MSHYQIAIELHYADMIAEANGICELQPADDGDDLAWMELEDMDFYYNDQD